jgi:hypothetical protein
MTAEVNGNVLASARGARPSRPMSGHRATDARRLIRLITALAVGTAAAVAVVISHQDAYELVSAHGEAGTNHAVVAALRSELLP